MKAYLRLDPLIDERKAHYTPAQLGAFVKMLALAGRQTDRGRFRSLETLKRALPPNYSRQVDFLVAEMDLSVQPDGRVYVEGWDEWQEGDYTVGDRMSRLRNRHRNAGVTEPYRSATGVDVGIGVGVDESYTDSEPRADIEAFCLVTRKMPTEKQRRLLDGMASRPDLGVKWMEAIVLANPNDPIGALIAADRAKTKGAEAREKADEIERNKAKRAPLNPVQRQLAAALRERHGEEERYVPPEGGA